MTAAIRCIDLVRSYEGRPPVEAVRGLDLSSMQRRIRPYHERAWAVGGFTLALRWFRWN